MDCATEWSVHAVSVSGGDRKTLERIAREVRSRAGYGIDDFASAVRVAAAVVGPQCIVYEDDLSAPAYLRRRTDGAYEIVLRPNAPDVRFRILHETAHVAIRDAQLGLPFAEEERAANYVAAAIAAPAAAVERAHRYFGPTLAALRPIAKTFGLSQTSAHLRLGEVLEDERAILTAHNDNLLVRSDGAFHWAHPKIIPATRGEIRWRGLAKVEIAALSDGIDAGRLALKAK